MPRIEDARGLTLTNIVEQLDLRNQEGKRKLRSSGNELYVKEGQAASTSGGAREPQRKSAVDLVCASLVVEFGVTENQARRIIINVLRQEMPSQIAVSDVLKIWTLGKDAQRVSETLGRDMANAFELAQGINEFPRDESFDWASRRVKELSKGREKAVRPAYELKMSQLPMYGKNLDEAEKKSWLKLSKGIMEVRAFQLWSLPPEKKLSMLFALADYKNSLPSSPESLSELKRINTWENRIYDGFHMIDLTSVKETRALKVFFEEVSRNEIIRTGYSSWEKMSSEERGVAIQNLIDLHADKLGYAEDKPELMIYGGGPLVSLAAFSDRGNMLKITDNNDQFNSFKCTFNSTIHELTHKYQSVLIERLKNGQIDSDDPQYTQARVFKYANENYVPYNIYENVYGLEPAKAYQFYKNNPMEKAAFERGDSAEKVIPELFAQQDPTAVRGGE